MANVIKNKRGTTKPSSSDLVVGEIAVKTDDAKLYIENDSGYVFEVGETLGTFDSSVITYTVTVASKTSAHRYNGTGSSLGYKINGIFSPFLSLTPGNTYRFDQSDSSNANHPIRFYLEADKTTAYTTNVTSSGTAGSSGSYIQIVVTDSTPIILHYQCQNHGYMGNSLTSNSNSVSVQNITGNAATATALANARTIAGVSFDGTSNISLNNNAITNGAGYITATLTEEQVEDFVGGMVTGNTETGITVTYQDSDGTLDFVVASQTDNNFTTALKNKLDGIATGAIDGSSLNASNLSSGTVPSARLDTATTQSASDSSTKIATTAFTQSAIGNATISGSQISTNAIDTSKIVDDAITADKLANSINTAIAAKMPLAGGQFTGNITFSGTQTVDGRDLSVDGTKLDTIETNATADQSASEILTAIKTVDGASSGLDADLLDGQEGSHYLDYNNFSNTPSIPTNNNQLTNGAGYITSAALSGAGDGGNAALLDGIDSTQFLRADQDDTTTGNLTLGSSANEKLILQGSDSPFIRFKESTTNKAYIQWSSSGFFGLFNQEDSSSLRIKDSIDFSTDGTTYYSIWHAGNDGASSGLDSDLLDGQQGSYYLDYSNFSNTPTIPTNNNQLTNGAGFLTSVGTSNIADNAVSVAKLADMPTDRIIGREASGSGDPQFLTASEVRSIINVADGATNVTNNNQISNGRGFTTFDGNYNSLSNRPTIPTNNNQLSNGAGYITSANGGNAATLDGIDSSQFVRSDTSDTITATLTARTIVPQSGNTYDLGSSSARWNNIYVNDLHFSNSPENVNKIDGTWGDWTLQEGENQIYMLNNRNGKKYKMNLTEID